MSSKIQNLMIINEYGTLVQQREFNPLQNFTENEVLRLASGLQVQSKIAEEIAPNPSKAGPITLISTDEENIQINTLLKGVKLVIMSHKHIDVDELMQKVKVLQIDQINKHPFVDQNQPLKVDQFDIEIDKLFKRK